MSAAKSEERAPEIIIVRRRSDDEDEGHHGGVWKIAFADFMTALMCFFLVMWLINAANEQTRVALASYFNPVKLIDRNTSSKGLEDIGSGPQQANPSQAPAEGSEQAASGAQDRVSGPSNNQNASSLPENGKFSDENLFSDPYAVLAEIAADTGTLQNISQKGDGGAQDSGPSSGASGGESYRDPFAPDFWSQQVATPQMGVGGDPDEVRENPAGSDIEVATNGKYEPASAPAEQKAEIEKPDARETAQYTPVPPLEVPEPQPAEATAKAEARKMREKAAEEMRAEFAKLFAGSPLSGSVNVVAGEDGVIISITDDMKHGMFPIGSAVPERALVDAMDKIGATLAKQPGAIKIGGHTDGRPFRNKTYDNWRLSTARAHAAYYMLVRGGVAEKRIGEVAGFADRKLKVAAEPYDSTNRRIEILLELPQ